MKNSEENVFSYRYSADEQKEINKIRKKYVEDDCTEDKMEQLRRLDKSVTKKGRAAALIVGGLSTLVLGGGMSLTLEGAEEWFLLGIVIGVVGMIGAIMAYPLYAFITKRERERIAPEIIKLTDELLK